MASELISICLVLQCWSPIRCPALFFAEVIGADWKPLQHFPFLGIKECQTWSWHVLLHLSVYVNRYQRATQKLFHYRDQNTCVWYFTFGTQPRSQGWLCQFPEISLMSNQAHFYHCAYTRAFYTAARTHSISFCHSEHQLRVRVQNELTASQVSLQWGWKKDRLQLCPFC